MLRQGGPIMLVAASLLLVGCSEQGGVIGVGTPAAEEVDELTRHDGVYCPDRLPRAPEETYGFGTDEPAETAPELAEPEMAWVCTYGTETVGHTEAGGTWSDWVRDGRPRRLDDEQLTAVTRALDDLVPADRSAGCNADLGPRYLVSYSAGRDLTGVVVDDYGCDDVRLTDDPFTTVPGEASQPGTVPGVLDGGRALLAALRR